MKIALKPAPHVKPAANALLPLLFYPTGVYSLWKNNNKLWIRLLYTILGLPVFLFLSVFFSIVAFALFLPDLDLSIGDRQDRTVINTAGNYATTFLETGKETGGAYELVRVELEPHGGNDWHYHKAFDEQFTVEAGEMAIGLEGQELVLQKGETVTALREQMHYFKNNTDETAVLLVKASPARGLEKTIRVGYGLANDGQITADGFTKNPWHMVLLMGYSESYLADIPPFMQEPLVKSLAKIAQWKGEDKALEKYFR